MRLKRVKAREKARNPKSRERQKKFEKKIHQRGKNKRPRNEKLRKQWQWKKKMKTDQRGGDKVLKASSYEEESVYSLKRNDVIDKSENRSSRQIGCKKREITGEKLTSQEIDWVVHIRQSRCKHVWAPSLAGDEH